MTIHELFMLTWERHWSLERYQNSRWAQEVRKYYEKHVKSRFGHVLADSLTFQEVRQWHRSRESTPYAANRSLEVLSRIYSFGIEEGVVTHNPCSGMKGFPEKKRRRYAREEELKRIGEILRGKLKTHRLHVTYVYLAALTGARPESLFRLKRENLHRRGNAGVLYFHGKETSDSGEDESIVLPEFLLKLIDALPLRDDGLLIGPVRYREFWEEVRKQAGCPDLRFRDLRRTFGTVGLSDGVDLNVIGEILNHRSVQTTKTYARLVDSRRVSASVKIADKVGEMMGVGK